MISFKELQGKMIEYGSVFQSLQNAINSEINAMLQYTLGIPGCKNENVIKEFDQHAKEEYAHAIKFYNILLDLGGFYYFTPLQLDFNSDCKFKMPIGHSKIMDNIKGEQCAINSYENLLMSFDFSKEHKEIIRGIIKDEEEHVRDLKKLLEEVKENK